MADDRALLPPSARITEFASAVQELSAALSVCTAHMRPNDVTRIDTIQTHLAEILTCVSSHAIPSESLVGFVRQLEEWGCEIERVIPALSFFLIPGGHPAAAFLHLARAICRRVERNAVGLELPDPPCHVVCQTLNRLSDYLFLLARYENVSNGVEELRVSPASTSSI
jgi:cob(I)alamin adenosyltransferase